MVQKQYDAMGELGGNLQVQIFPSFPHLVSRVALQHAYLA